MLHIYSNVDGAITAQSTVRSKGNTTARSKKNIVALSESRMSCELNGTLDLLAVQVETSADNAVKKSLTNGLSYRELLDKEETELGNTFTMEMSLNNNSNSIVSQKMMSLSVVKSKYLRTRKEVISGCQVFISLIK